MSPEYFFMNFVKFNMIFFISLFHVINCWHFPYENECDTVILELILFTVILLAINYFRYMKRINKNFQNYC